MCVVCILSLSYCLFSFFLICIINIFNFIFVPIVSHQKPFSWEYRVNGVQQMLLKLAYRVLWDLATLKKLNTEKHFCPSKFGKINSGADHVALVPASRINPVSDPLQRWFLCFRIVASTTYVLIKPNLSILFLVHVSIILSCHFILVLAETRICYNYM